MDQQINTTQSGKTRSQESSTQSTLRKIQVPKVSKEGRRNQMLEDKHGERRSSHSTMKPQKHCYLELSYESMLV
jgi:hypothetical protein